MKMYGHYVHLIVSAVRSLLKVWESNLGLPVYWKSFWSIIQILHNILLHNHTLLIIMERRESSRKYKWLDFFQVLNHFQNLNLLVGKFYYKTFTSLTPVQFKSVLWHTFCYIFYESRVKKFHWYHTREMLPQRNAPSRCLSDRYNFGLST